MQIKQFLYSTALLSAQFVGSFAAALPQDGGLSSGLGEGSSIDPLDPSNLDPESNQPLHREPKNIGWKNHVYVANDHPSKKPIHVMAALNPDWAIADVVTDVALLAVGVTEIKKIATAAVLPETIKTVRDLYQFLKITAGLISGSLAVGARPAEALLHFAAQFKKVSIPIEWDNYADVKDQNALELYTSASGVASILGASNVSLMVMSDDGSEIAMFNTNSDDSWIATKDGVTRSKYGTIWTQSREDGFYPWTQQ